MTNEQLKDWGCVNSRMGPVPCQMFGVSCVSHVREPREWHSNSTGYDMHGCVILREMTWTKQGAMLCQGAFEDKLWDSIWSMLDLTLAGFYFRADSPLKTTKYILYIYFFITRCFTHWTHKDTQLKMKMQFKDCTCLSSSCTTVVAVCVKNSFPTHQKDPSL